MQTVTSGKFKNEVFHTRCDCCGAEYSINSFEIIDKDISHYLNKKIYHITCEIPYCESTVIFEVGSIKNNHQKIKQREINKNANSAFYISIILGGLFIYWYLSLFFS